MALFGKEGRDRHDRFEREETRVAGEEPARKEREFMSRETIPSVAASGEVNAYLGKGSRVTGKLSFEGTVRVDGQVEGEVTAQDTLIVGDSAVVNAQISGSCVIITGKVTGDITARERVEIRAPGKLFGNVTTPSLIIQEGVIFEGHCSMGGSEVTKTDRKVTPFPKDDRISDASIPKVVNSEVMK
jgi:cytoskeletal protein CcmA (bactofilin family)